MIYGCYPNIFFTKLHRIGKRVIDFDEKVLAIFMKYHWPGNIRELENVIEYSVHLTNKEVIGPSDLPDHFHEDAKLTPPSGTLKEIVEQTEKKTIADALKKTDGNKQQAAKMLGLGKSSLYEKIKKYKL